MIISVVPMVQLDGVRRIYIIVNETFCLLRPPPRYKFVQQKPFQTQNTAISIVKMKTYSGFNLAICTNFPVISNITQLKH